MKMSVCLLVEMHETILELDITESKNIIIVLIQQEMKTISEMGNVVYMVKGKNQAVPLSFFEMPAKYFP